MYYSIIIVAAGQGIRMNLGYNKAYYRFKNNKTILQTTIEKFLNDEKCNQIVVVTDIQDYKENINISNGKIVIVEGGASRQESVYNGMHAVIGDVVLVHDGARPFVSERIIEDVINTLKDNDACCVMIPIKDTLKKVKDGNIIETIDRDTVRFAQTPQGFKTQLLWTCLKKAFADNYLASDDAALIEKYSDVVVKEVIGDESNFKITTPLDIEGL
ncbi:MAG: 2-C-methyl-D-erythritol 4-phosphate cytidylyltransferase [Erysipelotrichaceae bacterium]|nr:2-C-methyl-D-erythritol 4-phosphate cytidylyltransferase [Erysipelotrichaceae bacterium]